MNRPQKRYRIINPQLQIRKYAESKPPRRGDIIEIDCSPSTGREMRDPHRALVISDDAYNAKFRMAIVLVITTVGMHARENHFAVSLMGAGISTDGVIICDQPRSMDLNARTWRPIEPLPDFFLEQALAITAQLIGAVLPE